MKHVSRNYVFLGVAIVFVLCVVMIVFSRMKHREEKPAPALPVMQVESTPKHRVIASSVEGRPIDAYSYGHGSTQLLFVGGMHGGYEWNSVLLAYKFMDYLDQQDKIIPEELTITVIPSLNPDGIYKILKKEGRFSLDDVPKNTDTSIGRFNAHSVDLNRNFDCKWKPKSMWKDRVVSAGTAAFSEPESAGLRDFVLAIHPSAVVFWHSKSNAVYASECKNGILPETLKIMDVYASAAKYPQVKSFDSYAVTGDAEGWLASINIPAVTVELSTHNSIEWDRNLLGLQALTNHYVGVAKKP